MSRQLSDPNRTLREQLRGHERAVRFPAIHLVKSASMSTPKNRSNVPRPAAKRAAQFQRAVNRIVREQIRQGLDHLIAHQNSLHLRHGRGWVSPRANDTEFRRSEVSTETSFTEVLANDVTALPWFIDTVTEALVQEMSTAIYSTVSKAAESVGNVVSRRSAGSDAEAFLEMIRRTEFGVDSEGRVTMPTLHASPEEAERIIANLNAQGPDFHRELEQLKEQKAVAALQRERERRGRYRRRTSEL
jgi:hypothetical protein